MDEEEHIEGERVHIFGLHPVGSRLSMPSRPLSCRLLVLCNHRFVAQPQASYPSTALLAPPYSCSAPPVIMLQGNAPSVVRCPSTGHAFRRSGSEIISHSFACRLLRLLLQLNLQLLTERCFLMCHSFLHRIDCCVSIYPVHSY